MSLKINRDNIFMMNPKNGYFDDSNSDDSMANDFTLFVRAKLNPDKLSQTDKFIISRSGAHSGISALTDAYQFTSYIQYSYWIWDNSTSTPKLDVRQVHHKLEDTDFDSYMDLALIHSKEQRTIFCYFNGTIVGEITYKEDELPALYDNSPYWFGCGSMLLDGEKQDGEYEYDMAFSIRTALDIDEIKDITENYKTKYCETIFDDNLIFKRDWKLAKEFTFFCDFEKMSRYKIWNYAFTGNFPQLYVDNVTHY